jgi:hypothetical protein
MLSGNLNCSLGTVRLSAITLGGGKGLMRYGKKTWNAWTLHRAGAINELVKEIDKYRIDICVLQEFRWLGKGTVTKRIMILYSGHKSDKQFDRILY